MVGLGFLAVGPATAEVAKPSSAASGKAGEAPAKTLLRVRNRTPFILYIYVAGVRVGWIKPFRTEVLRGLRRGRHKVYLTSRYGSGRWGPRRLYVPGNWNVLSSAGNVADDASALLAGRLYRRNRASLAACDHMARRRAEELGRGDFLVEVATGGKAVVKVSGEASARLRACYHAVASRWEYPATGERYTLKFQHIGR